MTPPENPAPTFAQADIPVFDTSVLCTMFGNEPALIASVLQTFGVSTKAALAELALALGVQNLNAVIDLAHKIAGACRISGALALGDCARRLEQAAKQCDMPALTQGFAELESLWELTHAAIAQSLASP